MSTPLVSVVVPMFNAASTVAASIASLQRQDLTDWEAVVVDDGSADGSAAVVREIAACEPRVSLVQQANQGVSSARNTGMRSARGRYLAWLDPDDRLCDGALGTLMRAAENSDGAAVGDHNVVDLGGGLLHAYRLPQTELGLRELVIGASTRCGAHLVRRDLCEGVWWDEALTLWEDRDFAIRLAESGVRWRCVNRVVTEYVIQPGSLSKRALDMLAAGEQVLRGVFARQAKDPWFAESRLGGLLAENAMASAHRAAAISGDGELAASRLQDLLSRAELAPDLLAADRWVQATRFGVIFGCGEVPGAPGLEMAWARGVDGLWAAMGFSSEQRLLMWADFVAAVVSPQALAGAMLDRVGNTSGVVVVGYGHNGRAVVEEAQRRGLPVRVRDDFGTVPEELREPMGAAIPGGWSVLVTPYADSSLRERFADAAIIYARDTREVLVAASGWDPSSMAPNAAQSVGGHV